MKNLIFLSLIFLISYCSAPKLNDFKFFDVEVNLLEMWFDAMPKVEARSKFHIVLDYSLRNISNKELRIDSLKYGLAFSNGDILIFYDDKFYPVTLSHNEDIRFQNLNLSSEIVGMIPGNDRKADLYLNVNFTIGSKKFSEKVLIKSQEYEIVY